LTALTIVPSSGIIIIIITLFLATPHIYAQQAGITIKEWEVPTSNSAPHDIVVDERNGIVWFTEINANKIGKFDPTTEQFQEFDIPTLSSRPHGLVVDQDGNVWFTEMEGSKIGKLDVDTGQVVAEFPTPTLNSGPHTNDSGTRRIAIDSNGKLWFTEYNAAKIGSFDPKTNEFKEFETTTPDSGPYAIWVDIFDNVWFSMTNAFKVGKLDQSTDTVQEYDLPTPSTIIRFIYADGNDGNIWFPNNNNNKIGVIMQSTE
jgi:virginiamycin B lyase